MRSYDIISIGVIQCYLILETYQVRAGNATETRQAYPRGMQTRFSLVGLSICDDSC